VRPISGTGGKSQLFWPCHGQRTRRPTLLQGGSTGSRSGPCVAARGVQVGDSMTSVDAGEAIDRVWPPALVEPAEEAGTKAVSVLKHGHHQRQEVSADVLLTGSPDCLQGERPGQLCIVELQGQALKVGD
jgi:hypothetical protein